MTIDDVYAAFIVSDEAKAITGNIAYVDAGYHVMMQVVSDAEKTAA